MIWLPNRAKIRLVSGAVLAPLLLSLSALPAHASDAVALPTLGTTDLSIVVVALLAGVFSVAAALSMYAAVKRMNPGTEKMEEVGKAIRDGSMAYLRQQVRTMLPLVGGLAVLLFFLYKGQDSIGYTAREAIGVSFFFILGVGFSYLSGYVGMGMATLGNQRTAHQARTTFKGAMETAFKSGAVSGLMTVGLGLIGASLVFLIYREKAMLILIGFGFGGSLAALFMRVGGGIFTKAADVGADLVGKLEAGIPEDDPRNPATIADNVGDNVGDCAGMAADVFESYEVTLVASIILGAAVIPQAVWSNTSYLASAAVKLALFPLIVMAIGIVASLVGILSVRGNDAESFNPMKAINKGMLVTSGVATAMFTFASYLYFSHFGTKAGDPGLAIPLPDGSGERIYEWWRFALASFVGILLAVAIGRLTEYFTSTDKRPVSEVAHASKTGAATLVISGFSLGLESAVWTVGSIALSVMAALLVFPDNALLAAYGVALAGLGLLTTTGYVLAMDTFGPITDNAQGIFEMSGVMEEDRASGSLPTHGLTGDKIVGRLDAVGNTTKALTKGFAIATAVIAAVALFRSFMTDAQLLPPTMAADWSAMANDLGHGRIVGIPLDVPEVFIGLLIGGAAPFLFSSFAINAVGRAAFQLIEEVRRQFRNDPGIMEGTSKPDYARCVAISTAAAQRELLGPGVLAITLPILVGFGLGFRRGDVGAAALGGYLAGAILSGSLMATMLSNAGGAWDNAKKKIEDGLYGGKGSDCHTASVIGDTVGDPFKDTAGPGLNPFIKVMNLTGVLIAGILIQPISPVVRGAIVVISGGILTAAILFSKRHSVMGTEYDGDAPAHDSPAAVPTAASSSPVAE